MLTSRNASNASSAMSTACSDAAARPRSRSNYIDGVDDPATEMQRPRQGCHLANRSEACLLFVSKALFKDELRTQGCSRGL